MSILTKDDENSNTHPASFGRYSHIEYQLNKGIEILEDKIDDNFFTIDTRYKSVYQYLNR